MILRDHNRKKLALTCEGNQGFDEVSETWVVPDLFLKIDQGAHMVYQS